MKKRRFIIETWKFSNKYGFTPECAICGKKIENGELAVVIPTSSYYANYKGIVVYHLGCFLKELKKKFSEYIKLTEKGKKLIIEKSV